MGKPHTLAGAVAAGILLAPAMAVYAQDAGLPAAAEPPADAAAAQAPAEADTAAALPDTATLEPADAEAAAAGTTAQAQAPQPYNQTVAVATSEPPAAAAEPQKQARRGGIEEVVVTAQKREENLQSVPISIQAFTGETLTDKGVSDTQTLTQITPGLVYNSNAGFAMAYIRGIGSDAPLPTADPSVATYVDGVYYPMNQSTIQSFANLERIEVLKGPQGTLFGRNTTGGAINVVTKDPGNFTEYKLEAEAGNYKHRRGSAYVNLPIGEWFAVSGSGFIEQTDAYYKQMNPDGPPILDAQNWGFRPKFAFTPGGFGFIEDLKMVASAYVMDHHGADTNVKTQFKPTLLALALGASADPHPYETATDLPDTNYTRMRGADLKTTIGFGPVNLVGITGYQIVNNRGFVDYDATPAAGAGFGAQPGHAENFSQELQLVSTDNDRLKWVVGGYYFKGQGGFQPLNFLVGSQVPSVPLLNAVFNNVPVLPVPPGIALTLGQLLNLPIPNTPEAVANLVGALQVPQLLTQLGLDGLTNLPGDAVYVDVPLTSIVKTNAYAAFGQATWNAYDWLHITVGLRYSNEKRTLSRNQIYQPRFITDPTHANLIYDVPGQPLVSRPRRSKSWSDFSPKISFEFPFEDLAFVDNGLFYISRTEGFKSGTWNPVALTAAPDPVEPETVVSYETGFKTDLFDHNVRFNASAFHYDYKNLQITSIALTSGGAVSLENAGKAVVNGADFELTVVPLEGLQAMFVGSVLDSRYKVCNCKGFEPNSGLGFKGNFAGNELVQAPPFTGTADISYTFGAPAGSLELAGTYYYNSGYWFNTQNSYKQDAYATLSGRISYLHERSSVRLSLYGQNLTDEKFFINGNVNDFGTFATYAPPRMYGVRLQWPAK